LILSKFFYSLSNQFIVFNKSIIFSPINSNKEFQSLFLTINESGNGVIETYEEFSCK